MKKLLLVGLMMLAGSAWAQWEFIIKSESSSSEMTNFIDPSTIKKNGKTRKAWGVTNFSSKNKSGAFSHLWLEEYDCNEEQARYLALSSHSEQFAQGEAIVVNSINPKDAVFKPVPPRTMQSGVMKFVCSQ